MSIIYMINYKLYFIFIISLIILFYLKKFNIICLFIIISIVYNLYFFNYKKQIVCRNSTINNPLGNTLITTKSNDLKINDCDIDNEIINKNIEYNQYFNSNDFYKNKNNNSIYIKYKTHYPNNIQKFFNYLYKTDKNICKINNNCGKKINIRFDRYNIL